MTVWPARQVGDELWCGRTDHQGRYICQGMIGYYREVASDDPARRLYAATPGFGCVETPAGSGHWEPRGAAVPARGSAAERAELRRFMRGGRQPDFSKLFPAAPWTRTCPRCGHLAEVRTSRYSAVIDAEAAGP